MWRPPPVCRMRVHSDLDARITVVRLSPGFDDSAIAAMIQHAPEMRGLVLSLYGTGNGPSHKEVRYTLQHSDLVDTYEP